MSDTAAASVEVSSPPSSASAPTLVIFDGSTQNGFLISGNSGFAARSSTSGEPVTDGSNSVRLELPTNVGAWFETTSPLTISGTNGLLRFDIYVDQAGSAENVKLKVWDANWQKIQLTDINSDHWTIDGVSGHAGTSLLAPGSWHTVEVNLQALGLDTFRRVDVVGYDGDGVTEIVYVDNMGLWETGGAVSPDSIAHNLYGTSFAETLTGGDTNDAIYGLAGNDRLIGGTGTDRVILDGSLSDYTFTEHSNGVVIARNLVSGEADALIEIEEVLFAGDQTLHDLPDIITSVTIDPVPEFAATPLDGQISEGGFAYPVVIDLGGDGADLVSVTQSRVVFESDSGGPLMRMGWVGPKDGMLVLDRDGDGIINRLSEISFVNDLPGAKSDLEGLRAYDSNDDGVLDASDDAWSLFQVWRDVNQNGIGMGKELATLDEIGITSINLALTVVNESTDGFADSIVLNEAEIILASGASSTIFDVALRGELAHIDGPALAGTPAPMGYLQLDNGWRFRRRACCDRSFWSRRRPG